MLQKHLRSQHLSVILLRQAGAVGLDRGRRGTGYVQALPSLAMWPQFAHLQNVDNNSTASNEVLWGLNEMVGWHHQLNGHESERTPGDEGQGSLARCNPRGRQESDNGFKVLRMGRNSRATPSPASPTCPLHLIIYRSTSRVSCSQSGLSRA